MKEPRIAKTLLKKTDDKILREIYRLIIKHISKIVWY